MSRAATGNRQLATGGAWKDSQASFGANGSSVQQVSIAQSGVSPIAYCLLPIARSCAAIPCTVTPRQTSVTTLPLVESGLIIVGRAIGRLAKTAANCGLARSAHCSFQGGMCIQ